VLIAPAVVKLTVGENASTPLRILAGLVAFAIIAAAVIVSKRRRVSMGAPADRESVEAAAA
jgi:K(+)-stimulated pyrophosphate-energized sodium pump